VTVAQLEHALVARVRVEQAIGVLAERHRLRPRQAFDLLRNVARPRGQKITDLAEAVVDSTSNPLLPLPDELARPQPPPRKRGLSPRHRLEEQARTGENVAAKR
jgi:ANTAR domain